MTVTVTTPPTLGTYPNTGWQFGSGIPVIPTAAPSDNGVIGVITASATGIGNLGGDLVTGDSLYSSPGAGQKLYGHRQGDG